MVLRDPKLTSLWIEVVLTYSGRRAFSNKKGNRPEGPNGNVSRAQQNPRTLGTLPMAKCHRFFIRGGAVLC